MIVVYSPAMSQLCNSGIGCPIESYPVDLCYVVARGRCIDTKSRSGCFDKPIIVEKGIDQNYFQCRYRLSLGLELDLDVEINRSNAGSDLCNTHTHINGSPFLI